MRMVLRMKWQIFILAAEIPCEWTFATTFTSDCECDGVVYSVPMMQKRSTIGHLSDEAEVSEEKRFLLTECKAFSE